MTERCDNCKFHREIYSDEIAPLTVYCKRFPPITPVMEEGKWYWYTVEVDANDWCGEWSKWEAK